ncbi:MAG: chromosomal replication initiator protein DnaA [Dermabacter sp.]|nr:chromosomal replication initiator protein DnaA [Dermabacter sp.]
MDQTAPARDELHSPDDLWARCLQILRADESVSDRHIAFLTLSSLRGFLDDTALIAVPSASAKDLFEIKIPRQLRDALSQAAGRPVSFAVTVDETLVLAGDDDDADLVVSSPSAAPAPVPGAEQPASRFTRTEFSPADSAHSVYNPVDNQPVGSDAPHDPAAGSTSTLGNGSRLNSKYTFDTFVVGSSNRFAQAAAYAVAEQPALAYNPLFIYGGSGLGKTHLLHATGHYAERLHPNIQVRYVNSEEFTNDFINSVQSGQFGRAQEFQRRYRDIDILLIDDIQFLQRAPETMEAFFHTFNTLHNANKQIVITSDLPPKQLGGFEDRMRSRFEMGLMTDVQPPDLETRIAILRKKVAAEGNDEVPHEVLEYIAENISTNIRELEGALIRVQALHSLSRAPMDVALAESVLKDLLTHDGAAEITASVIIAETASYFGMSVDDIKGTARTRALVTARQIAMYLCRELTEMPLMAIGAEFGGRDHTTVIHANKKVSHLMKERRALFNQVTELTARVKSNAQEQARH